MQQLFLVNTKLSNKELLAKRLAPCTPLQPVSLWHTNNPYLFYCLNLYLNAAHKIMLSGSNGNGFLCNIVALRKTIFINIGKTFFITSAPYVPWIVHKFGIRFFSSVFDCFCDHVSGQQFVDKTSPFH